MTCLDDDSVDAATMQSTTDPYPADTVSLSTTLQGELRRLRYVVKKLTGWTQWYAHSEAFVFPNAFRFSSVGPHAIGGATVSTSQLLLTGTFAGGTRGVVIGNGHVMSPAAGASAYIFSVDNSGSGVVLTKAGSGVHADFVGAFFGPPTIGAGAAALTNASTVKIDAAPTGATNNYALWVAGGNIRVADGAILGQAANLTTTGPTISFASDNLDFSSGSLRTRWFASDRTTERMRLTAGGLLLVGDTTNANMTVGLTLNQGANDDEIVALKSSDVGHGITDLAEADTFGVFRKAAAATGGLSIFGYRLANSASALLLTGRLDGTADTAKLTSAVGVVTADAAIRSVATVTAVGADGNLFAVTNNGTARFIFDAEGSAHADVEWIAFQDHDDATLLRNVERELARGARPAGPPSADRQELATLGVVALDGPSGERGLVNTTRLQMLQAGAVRQAHDVIDLLLDDLMSRRPLTPQEKARIPAGIRARKGITP